MTRLLTDKQVLEIADLAEKASDEDRQRHGDFRDGARVINFGSKESERIVRDIIDGPTGARKTLHDTLADLNDDELGEVTAIMLAGRGDYEGTFDQARQLNRRHDRAEREGYVTGKTKALSTYLHKGLQKAPRG